MSVVNVSSELRLKMFEGVDSNDIMYQDELDALENMDDFVTIYRGAPSDEIIPGLSWSIYKSIAESSDYQRGKLFRAVIPKNSILLYIAHDGDEGEIIADVSDKFEVIEERRQSM